MQHNIFKLHESKLTKEKIKSSKGIKIFFPKFISTAVVKKNLKGKERKND